VPRLALEAPQGTHRGELPTPCVLFLRWSPAKVLNYYLPALNKSRIPGVHPLPDGRGSPNTPAVCWRTPTVREGVDATRQKLLLGSVTTATKCSLVGEMDTSMQLVLVGLLVAAAAVYVLRSAWKTWAGKSEHGCGAACGKCSTATTEPKQEGRFPLPQL
jgi:hypothetical protein